MDYGFQDLILFLKSLRDLAFLILIVIAFQITARKYLIELKLADVIPILKKEDPSRAKNYRPVSVLPSVSKFYYPQESYTGI